MTSFNRTEPEVTMDFRFLWDIGNKYSILDDIFTETST